MKKTKMIHMMKIMMKKMTNLIQKEMNQKAVKKIIHQNLQKIKNQVTIPNPIKKLFQNQIIFQRKKKVEFLRRKKLL